MKKVEKPKKPLIFYYLIALVILILLNTFLFPNLMNHHKVKDVDYGTFLTMVDKKEVSKVELNGDTIYFTDKAAEPNYYETTTFEDPDLVNRLEEAGCEFGRIAQEEMNPLVSFLLVWVLPIVIFWVLGQFLAKRLMKKMGGVLPEIHLCSLEKAMPKYMLSLRQELHLTMLQGKMRQKNC